MKFFYSLLLIALLTFLACNRNPKVDYQQLVGELCTCSLKIYEQNQIFEKALQDKKQERAISLMDTLAITENKYRACIQSLQEKYKFFNDKNYLKDVEKVAKIQCLDKMPIIMKELSDERWSK